ncbi:hypothetical protein A5638_12355 [Mycolicibacterium fortuitum]|nr:hypothetical protein A5638_12355 [Mycolicibacterium fortuitum]
MGHTSGTRFRSARYSYRSYSETGNSSRPILTALLRPAVASSAITRLLRAVKRSGAASAGD